jgi:hypothetical protein
MFDEFEGQGYHAHIYQIAVTVPHHIAGNYFWTLKQSWVEQTTLLQT